MKRPIGVYASLAIVVFLLALAIGSAAGFGVARWRVQRQQNALFHTPEQHRLWASLEVLNDIMIVHMMTSANISPATAEQEVKHLENLKSQSADSDIQPVIAMNLGLAYAKT